MKCKYFDGNCIHKVRECSKVSSCIRAGASVMTADQEAILALTARVKELEAKLCWATSQWDRCVKRIAELSKALDRQATGDIANECIANS